jgi:hypothetical protein
MAALAQDADLANACLCGWSGGSNRGRSSEHDCRPMMIVRRCKWSPLLCQASRPDGRAGLLNTSGPCIHEPGHATCSTGASAPRGNAGAHTAGRTEGAPALRILAAPGASQIPGGRPRQRQGRDGEPVRSRRSGPGGSARSHQATMPSPPTASGTTTEPTRVNVPSSATAKASTPPFAPVCT